MRSETLVSRFYAEAVRIPDAPVLMVKRDGRYRAVSWRALEQRVRALATALIGLGVRPGDRVGILSENRQEWIEADFAIMSVGAITVALHAALTSRQVRDQFTDAAPVVVFASHPEQLEKLLEVWGALPGVKTIVPFEPATSARAAVTPYTDLLEAGKSPSDPGDGELERRIRDARPADTAAIIYTSGTTGESKGVMLTHSNFVSNVKAMIARQPPEDVGEQAVRLVYLPLSHVYARTCDLYVGFSTEQALALAESIDTLMLNLQEVQPHYMIGVPRVYEKLVSAARDRKEAGDRNGLRNVLGGRIRWCSGGGAALSPEIARFFFEAGVPLYQGYGLTETSPVISMSCDGQSKFGAAGTLIERVEVKIAPDGEILSRGPHIMKGYWNKPKATAEAIDSEGWFHTGDVGRLDDEGFLFITDRKKDIFVSSYGKNIAPQLIEGLLAFDAFIEQACIYGDGKKYLTALVVPAAPQLLAWAAANSLPNRSVDALVALPEVHVLYAERIATALADLSAYEQIKDFVLLAEPFSAATGTMTSTAKLRRKQIMERHREALEALYTD
jgi:long-chain acyl-CoA synthetase